MKRLVLADVKSQNDKGKSIGHYFSVAQNYLDLYSDCCQVKVAGGPMFKTRFNEKDIFQLPHDFIIGQNWLRNKWRVLMNCKYLFKHTSVNDIIVIQQSGLSTAILGIALFAKKKRNIYIISYDKDAVSSFAKRLIYQFAKQKIKGLLCPSRHVADAYCLPSCIITDYIYPFYTNKLSFVPFEEKKYDVAIIGSICHGKGVIKAAETLTQTNYKVLIAGKADKQLSEQLEKICLSSSNIELRLGFVSDDDYCKYIRAARFCILNYHGVYEDRSSGVVLDILFNGTPILGHRCKALMFVEKEDVGVLFEDISDFDFSVIFDVYKYNCFLSGIIRYLSKQKDYKLKVIDFLGLRK